MRRSCPRIFCLLILVFASSACGAGSQTKNNATTATATLTQFVLPPEATQTLTEPPGVNPEGTINSTPVLTLGVTDSSTLSPATGVSKTAPPVVHPSVPLCNDAIYVADVSIPDGTILLPEKEFTKTWKLKNTGTCRWTTAYAIGFSHGNSMKGREMKLPNSVDPGQTVDVSIDMTAPKENGWYGGWWRLKSDTGSYFGDFVFVSILVSDGRGTNPPPPG